MFEPTIKDIAKICGVGVSTVSRAINDHPDINSETKEKIMNAIQEYGYVPNDSARNLKRVDAKAIAVLVKGIANPFFTSMITVIEQECKKRHYSMELSHVEADENEVDVAQKVVKEKRLRGIIFLGGLFSHSEEKLKKLAAGLADQRGIHLDAVRFQGITVPVESQSADTLLQRLRHEDRDPGVP